MANDEETRTRIERFLAEPRNVMVAAIRKDGRPQMTPNWFLWDGERFAISTAKTRRKYPNLRRDPRLQLAVDDSTGYRTLLVDGAATFEEAIAPQVPVFRAILEKYGREVPGDAEIHARLEREQRVLLYVTPDRPLLEWTRWGF